MNERDHWQKQEHERNWAHSDIECDDILFISIMSTLLISSQGKEKL